MLKSSNITTEPNYIPSGERWECREFRSENNESLLEFLCAVSILGWNLGFIEVLNESVYRVESKSSSLSEYYKGIFKRKLVAI